MLGRSGACESARRSGRGRAVVDQHAVCGASVVQHALFLTRNVSRETTELVFTCPTVRDGLPISAAQSVFPPTIPTFAFTLSVDARREYRARLY